MKTLKSQIEKVAKEAGHNVDLENWTNEELTELAEAYGISIAKTYETSALRMISFTMNSTHATDLETGREVKVHETNTGLYIMTNGTRDYFEIDDMDAWKTARNF